MFSQVNCGGDNLLRPTHYKYIANAIYAIIIVPCEIIETKQASLRKFLAAIYANKM